MFREATRACAARLNGAMFVELPARVRAGSRTRARFGVHQTPLSRATRGACEAKAAPRKAMSRAQRHALRTRAQSVSVPDAQFGPGLAALAHGNCFEATQPPPANPYRAPSTPCGHRSMLDRVNVDAT